MAFTKDTIGRAADLVTSDGLGLYGSMYDGGGDAYGAEINGVSRNDQPMEDRFEAFLQSPAIVALSTDSSLESSIETGLSGGDAALVAAGLHASDVSQAQVAFWMREMSEVALIDFIMSQQDRITNFDNRAYYYWVVDGKSKRKRARDLLPGEGKIPIDAVRIYRTRLNDNDAAGRPEYDNHAMQQGLLEKLHHFDAEIYQRLLAMSADFQNKGPIYEWLSTSFGLESEQVDMIVMNTTRAADTLRATCARGELRFDLDAKEFFVTGQSVSADLDCVGS